MAEPPVVNASPLIYLTRCGLLELLRMEGELILVPAAVAGELQGRGPNDPAARMIADTSWLKVVETPPVPKSVQSWDLGPGESAVLSRALAHPGTLAILDDLAARRCAEGHAVPCRGTLGLVLAAKRKGRTAQARPLLMALRMAGMYLSDSVMNKALSLVGE